MGWFRHIFKSDAIKTRIALVEATIVAISTIFTMVKLDRFNFNINVLVLVPIYCLVISCNISSYTSIHLSITLFLGTLVGNLYIYLVVLISRNIIWITFITTFFFAYIMTTLVMVPGRKWMVGLFLKKSLLDVIVILYFSKNIENINSDLWHNIVASAAIVTTVFIGQIVFPTLASRLLFKRNIKTLIATKRYFKSIGYQLNEKSIKTTNEINNEINNNQQQFRPQSPSIVQQQQQQPSRSRSQSIQDDSERYFLPISRSIAIEKSSSDHIKFGTSPRSFDGTNDMNIFKLALSRSISIEKSSVIDINESVGSNSVIEIDDLKLPLSRSRAIEKGSVIDISKQQQPLESNIEMNTLSKAPLLSTTPTTTDISETTTTSNKEGNKEIGKSILSTNYLYKKIKIIKALGLQRTEEQLEIYQVKLSHNINMMTRLYGESKSENWNSQVNENYNKLLSMFEMSYKQLVSLKVAIQHGFTQLAMQELINPLNTFIECLVEEVYLQMGMMVDILNSSSSSGSSNQSFEIEYPLLWESFDETEILVNKLRAAFKQVVLEYQRGGHPILQDFEISKVHYFVHGVLSFTLQQRSMAQLLIQVKKQQRLESVRSEFIKHALYLIITGFPLFLLKIYKLIKSLFIVSSSSKGEEEELKVVGEKKRNIIIEWITDNFFRNNKWRYPLQNSIGMMSTIIPFYYLNGTTFGPFVINGVWTCVTVMIVMVPSVGGTITRGINRISGTIAGATVGFFASLLVHEIDVGWHPAREIVIIILTFMFIFLIAFPQQDPRHAYAGYCCGFTFLLVLLGQNYTDKPDFMYAVLRSTHISMGVFWNIILGLVVFPYFSYKNTRIKCFQIAKSMSDTFINIIENGLRINEPINSVGVNGENLQHFNQDEYQSQQYHKKHQEIKQQLSVKRKETVVELLYKHQDDILLACLKNNSNVDIINNIIQIPIDETKESIESTRKKNVTDILESLKQTRVTIDQIKASLIDIRFEMYFVSPSNTVKYISITDNVNDCFTRLVALANSYNPVFSDLMVLSKYDLREPLINLFESLLKSKADLKEMQASKFDSTFALEMIQSHSQLIKSSLEIFNQVENETRLNLLNNRVYHHLYPELIQYFSGVHAINKFIETYITLLEDLRFIRAEKSYLKSFLRLK